MVQRTVQSFVDNYVGGLEGLHLEVIVDEASMRTGP